MNAQEARSLTMEHRNVEALKKHIEYIDNRIKKQAMVGNLALISPNKGDAANKEIREEIFAE